MKALKTEERLPGETGNRIASLFEDSPELFEWAGENPDLARRFKEALCEFLEAFEQFCQLPKEERGPVSSRDFGPIGRKLVDCYMDAAFAKMTNKDVRQPIIMFLLRQL